MTCAGVSLGTKVQVHGVFHCTFFNVTFRKTTWLDAGTMCGRGREHVLL